MRFIIATLVEDTAHLRCMSFSGHQARVSLTSTERIVPRTFVSVLSH